MIKCIQRVSKYPFMTLMIMTKSCRRLLQISKICVNKLNNSYTKYFDYDKLNKLLDIRFKNVEDRIVVSESGNTKKLKKELTDARYLLHTEMKYCLCVIITACYGRVVCADAKIAGSQALQRTYLKYSLY